MSQSLCAALLWAGLPVLAQTLVLVENGAPRASIIVAPNASADDREAADELGAYVRKTTGASLPVGSASKRGARIYVGMGAAPPEARKALEGAGSEAYLIQVLPEKRLVVLAGKGRHTTSFAVYEFLERYAGVRWLWPGELGEVTPRSKRLAAPAVNLLREPTFLWRGLGPGGALWGPADRWQKERELGVSAAHQAEMRLWELRNRFGGLEIYGGHAFGEILPPAKFGPIHPEYYALVNGERDWRNFNGKHRAQLCTSNPEVVRLVIEYCRRKFSEHPEYDAVSISPNDGRGFCECENCRRLDAGEWMLDRADPETGRAGKLPVISDRMITFANQVAEGVAKTHPDKKVVLFAYGQYNQPPKRTRAHLHLIIQWTVNSAGWWNERIRREDLETMRGWSKMADNLGVYEYLTQGNFPDIPRLIPEILALELRELHKLGFRYYQTQAGNGFAVNGLNFYVLARLLWDPSADWRAILDDYTRTGFGPAAPAVKRYFERHIARWKAMQSPTVAMNDASIKDYTEVLAVYQKDYRDACRRDLEEAARVATGTERKRVDFLRQGFEYFDKTMEAAELTFPLLKAGWRPADGLRYKDPAQVAAAIKAWEERDRLVESHKEDFVLSYLWVKYNNELRGFNPLRRFRAAESARR